MADSDLTPKGSFSLTQKAIKGSQDSTWQEHAYERLKALYGIGKLLAYFDSVAETFPKIISLCASSFPVVTAVLIEKRGNKLSTSIWHAENAKTDQIERATSNAKTSYYYLTGASSTEPLDQTTTTTMGRHEEEVVQEIGGKNFIVGPMIVDNLPAFGIIQLEGYTRLTEADLEFVNALTDLIAVGVDRHYKTIAEQQLRQAEAKEATSKLGASNAHIRDLETEREMREKFVALLTHDLRTPLSAVKLSAQMIQRKPGNAESAEEFSNRIVANVTRADQMISDLLDANRISSGEMLSLNLELFSLPGLAKETLEELTTMHGDRFRLESEGVIEGYWDRRALRRVIENLCNNAVKYGSADMPIIVSVFKESKIVIISVQNQGETISEADQKILFEQYRRTEKARSSGKKGWGIGLTLARGVAEAHGGNIEVRSHLRSTVFSVKLPLDARPPLPH